MIKPTRRHGSTPNKRVATLVAIAMCIFIGMAFHSCVKYPLESGFYVFSKEGREAHRTEVAREEYLSGDRWSQMKIEADNDWFEGVTLWDATSGNTTPEYDRAVAASKHKNERLLRRALSCLTNNEALPEIKWIEFDDNNVYIGFDPYPFDGESILRGVAFVGNEAINFGCHVWAVPASQTDRTSVDRYYNQVTARYGKIR